MPLVFEKQGSYTFIETIYTAYYVNNVESYDQKHFRVVFIKLCRLPRLKTVLVVVSVL